MQSSKPILFTLNWARSFVFLLRLYKVNSSRIARDRLLSATEHTLKGQVIHTSFFYSIPRLLFLITSESTSQRSFLVVNGLFLRAALFQSSESWSTMEGIGQPTFNCSIIVKLSFFTNTYK